MLHNYLSKYGGTSAAHWAVSKNNHSILVQLQGDKHEEYARVRMTPEEAEHMATQLLSYSLRMQQEDDKRYE